MRPAASAEPRGCRWAPLFAAAALVASLSGPALADNALDGPLPIAVSTGDQPSESKTGFDEAAFAPFQGKVVSSILLNGNKHTKSYVVTREIWTKVGEPLSVATLAADHQRLQNIQVFSSVHVVPAAADSTVALVFDLHEMPPLLLFPALSFTDQNGWSYGVGASSINLTGRNISASGKALFGGTTTFSFSASDPWITGDHVSARCTVAHLERYDQLDGFDETDNYVLPWVGTYVRKYGRAGATINWLQVRSNVPGKTLDPDNVDNMYNTGIYLEYDSRKSVREPSNGWYVKYQEMHTGGFLGGNGDFWTTYMDIRKYSRGFGNTQIFAIGAFSEFQSGTVGVDVPEYLQFRMGGANSIRGYQLDSLGQTLYGKNQFIVTAEYSFQLRPIREYKILNWSFSLGLAAAVFVDNGIAWNQGSDFNAMRNQVGGGFGVRLLVPGMQMFRFDFAKGEGGGLLFAFGTGSKFDAQTNRIR